MISECDCPYSVDQIFTIRIGKFKENAISPLKIVCQNEEMAKWIVRSKGNTCNNTSFNIKRDKIRQQRQYARLQTDKLKKMNRNGEKYSIKYVKDKPVIIKNNKN